MGAHPSLARFWLSEMVSAMEHMHRRGLVHRDLKVGGGKGEGEGRRGGRSCRRVSFSSIPFVDWGGGWGRFAVDFFGFVCCSLFVAGFRDDHSTAVGPVCYGVFPGGTAC